MTVRLIRATSRGTLKVRTIIKKSTQDVAEWVSPDPRAGTAASGRTRATRRAASTGLRSGGLTYVPALGSCLGGGVARVPVLNFWYELIHTFLRPLTQL
jgi:hypothetical protein